MRSDARLFLVAEVFFGLFAAVAPVIGSVVVFGDGSCFKSHWRANSMFIRSTEAASLGKTAGMILRKFLCFSIRFSPIAQPVSCWKLWITSLKLVGSSSTMCSVINSFTTSLSNSPASGKNSESKSSVKGYEP